MSSFTKPLTTTKFLKKTKYRFLGIFWRTRIQQSWVTAKEFRYYIGEEGSDKFIDVPANFTTDFASVPRAFWIILPPDGIYSQAAVLHDYLYSIRGHLPDGVIMKRIDCDMLFREAMGVLGVTAAIRNIMYQAVRIFGSIPWNKKIKKGGG